MHQQINLYQPIFRKEPKKFSTRTLMQASVLVVVGAMGLYAYSYWQVRSLQADLVQVQNQQAALNKRLEDVSRRLAPQAKSRLLEREIARLERLIAAKSRVQQILARGVFANTDGYSEYMLALARQHVSGIWLTAFAIAGAGDELTLKGRTTTPELVPQYMQRLADERSLAGIEFQVFRMARPQADSRQPAPPYIEFLATTASGAKGGQP